MKYVFMNYVMFSFDLSECRVKVCQRWYKVEAFMIERETVLGNFITNLSVTAQSKDRLAVSTVKLAS